MRRLYQRETTKTTDVATFPQELPAEPPTPTTLVPLPELPPTTATMKAQALSELPPTMAPLLELLPTTMVQLPELPPLRLTMITVL